MNKFTWLGMFFFAASATDAVEFVSNGAFESGNALFTSDYTYLSPNLGLLTGASTYTVDNNPVDNHPSWASFGDHTSGSGLMFLANGAGSSGTVVWKQTISGLSIGEAYTYSAFAASVYPVSPASIRLSILGSDVDTKSAGTTIGTWVALSGTWVATVTSVELQILDMVTAGDGNDFALDDISLTGPVPEPGTCVGLGLGFAAWLRRKRISRLAPFDGD